MSTDEQPCQAGGSSRSGPQGPLGSSADGDGAQQQPQGGAPRHGVHGRAARAEHDVQRAATGIKDKLADKKQKIKDKKAPPGGFDRTPLPDAPPGYTVKFTFHRAWNLPMADLGSHSSDPYIRATLVADIPKRHKEDPPLVFRTRTIKRTTAPEWEQEWVVGNVPSSGFTLKCRLYDEDDPDHDDRLGNTTVLVPHIDEGWPGFGPQGRVFEVKKRTGSKRAYLLKAVLSAFSKRITMTPELSLSVDVLGLSDPPHAQMYTVGPTHWVKHFSPMIGRLAGVMVNRDEERDANGSADGEDQGGDKYKKYDFQSNEIQLAGPVPPKLYHRYVEFRPMIGRMFSSTGLRGRILNKALHKQHNRIYNYNSSTEYGSFEAQSREAALQFLKMVHFDEGGRIFTYVITLDGLMRFTETGREFGIDLLSKHTMHSDVALYVACAGEFFVRRRSGPDRADDPDGAGGPEQPGSPRNSTQGACSPPRGSAPPSDPSHYELIIDNDSGTYRPDKSVLPDLGAFLKRNLPGLHVRTIHCADEELSRLKDEQLQAKQRSGRPITNMVLNRSPTSSSLSSDDESRLAALERKDAGQRRLRTKRERALDALENPRRLKGEWKGVVNGGGGEG